MSKAYRKIYVNINSSCNYRCLNCLLSEKYRSDNINQALTVNLLKEIFSSLASHLSDKVKNLCEVSGGEPTIHPDLLRILYFLNELRDDCEFHKIVLLTNGHLLANETYSKEVAEFLDDCVISVYCADPKQHDKITGATNSLKCKLRAVENLLSNNVKVHVKLIVAANTFHQLPEISKILAERWGQEIIMTINGIHLVGSAWSKRQELAIRYSEAMPFVEEAIDCARSFKTPVLLFLPMCLCDTAYWEYFPIGYQGVVEKSYSITPDGKWGKARLLLQEFLNKHDLCALCPLQSRCNWPWEDYIEHFDDTEIIDAFNKYFI